MNTELQKRAEELEKKAEEKETARLEQLVKTQVQGFYRTRFSDIIKKHEENLKLFEKIRKQAHDDLIERENIVNRAIDEETKKKAEIRRKEIEKKREREREEKIRLAEEQRKKEEEEKRLAEQERLKKLEEEKKRIEAEERRRQEEIKLQQEEEKRRQREEKEIKIQEMLQEAEKYYNEGDLERALVLTAKALIHDPEHPKALTLYQKIKEPPKILEENNAIKEKKAEKEREIEKITTPLVEKPVRSKKAIYITLVALILIIIGIFAYRLVPVIFKSTPSIVVMPFKSAAGILEDDIIGTGLALDVNMRLSAIENFKPLGFASSKYIYENNSSKIKEIYQMGFNYVLDGLITRVDDGKKVDLKLTDSLGNVYWSNSFLISENKFNVLPVDICENLVDKFRVHIQDENIAAFRVSTFDNNAYLMYLRGLELLNRNTFLSVENANELFRQAIYADNSFAEAFAASGAVSIVKIENNWSLPQIEYNKAEDMFQKSIDAYRYLPAARRNKGLLYAYSRKFKTAEEELNLSIRLSPNDSRNFLALSKYYIMVGKYDAALDALLKGENLDPYNPKILEYLAGTHQLLANNKSALEKYSKVLTIIPDTLTFVKDVLSNLILFDAELQMGNVNRVINKYYQKIEHDPRNYIDMYKLARTYQVIGKRLESEPLLYNAQKILEKELVINPGNAMNEIYQALIYTRLGKFPDAIKYAEKGYNRDPGNVFILYKLAQMYSIQNKLDKAEEFLKKAISIHYDLNEILDIDFYNLRNSDKFKKAIRVN